MLKNKEFNKYIKFEKTIEDLFYDSSSGLFSEMAVTDGDGNFEHNNIPQFIADGLFDPDLLDVSFFGKFSERWLNKTSGNCYSVNLDGELVNPSNLSQLAQQILDYYYKKWDNLYYLYYSIVMGTDYNPIENYSSNETTTYNNVTDTLTKTGTERQSQKSRMKQKVLKTVDLVTDEYGTPSGGVYSNGIKDKTEYNRNYTQTEHAGTTGNNPVPFKSVDETAIAGMNSSGGTIGDMAGTGYNQSEKKFHSELGDHSSTFNDNKDNSNKLPYESTERTGKHTSLHEQGGKAENGVVTQGDLQETVSLDPEDNYTELSFRADASAQPRKDTNVKSGNFNVTKAGNIGVMTASQMLESAWNGEMERNFQDVVFKDIADFISLNCY